MREVATSSGSAHGRAKSSAIDQSLRGERLVALPPMEASCSSSSSVSTWLG